MFKLAVTEQIELKLLQKKHNEKLFELIDKNRNHLNQWLLLIDKIKTSDDILTFIDRYDKEYIANRGMKKVAIFYQEQIAGWIGIHYNWLDKNASIGYWLGKEFEGKGIVTTSCRKIIDYLFNELALKRLEIICASENKRSWAIPERLGFSFEVILHKFIYLNNHFVDCRLYSLLRND